MNSGGYVEYRMRGFRRQLAVSNAVEDDLLGGSLRSVNCFRFRIPIKQDIHLWHFGYPPAVNLLVELNGELHSQRLPLGTG